MFIGTTADRGTSLEIGTDLLFFPCADLPIYPKMYKRPRECFNAVQMQLPYKKTNNCCLCLAFLLFRTRLAVPFLVLAVVFPRFANTRAGKRLREQLRRFRALFHRSLARCCYSPCIREARTRSANTRTSLEMIMLLWCDLIGYSRDRRHIRPSSWLNCK